MHEKVALPARFWDQKFTEWKTRTQMKYLGVERWEELL